MQIVCGEHSLIEQPEKFSDENEVVLEILDIVNHEDFDPGQPGEQKGPYNGRDIAIYKVDASNLNLKRKVLYVFLNQQILFLHKKDFLQRGQTQNQYIGYVLVRNFKITLRASYYQGKIKWRKWNVRTLRGKNQIPSIQLAQSVIETPPQQAAQCLATQGQV